MAELAIAAAISGAIGGGAKALSGGNLEDSLKAAGLSAAIGGATGGIGMGIDALGSTASSAASNLVPAAYETVGEGAMLNGAVDASQAMLDPAYFEGASALGQGVSNSASGLSNAAASATNPGFAAIGNSANPAAMGMTNAAQGAGSSGLSGAANNAMNPAFTWNNVPTAPDPSTWSQVKGGANTAMQGQAVQAALTPPPPAPKGPGHYTPVAAPQIQFGSINNAGRM